ncbi:MAG: alpha/beta hydrolase [Herpetosiphonaceae bacterium]|nr:MAG: alpha/beta hydrolase [Herpetosiphonaceae bacterium]
MASHGCLILHGWTANRNHVIALAPHLEHMEIPYRIPLLRGHGTQPEDLYGVTWKDWYADVERAFDELLQEVDKVIVVGHSMGGLLALLLAARQPERIDAVVSVATALRVTNPLFGLSPYLARFYRKYKRKIQPAYSSSDRASSDSTYTWVPSSAIAELCRLTRVVEPELPKVRAPLLLIHSLADRVVSAETVEVIYRHVSSEEKRLVWFQRSGHEMFLDCEADAVVGAICEFIASKRQEQPRPVV